MLFFIYNQHIIKMGMFNLILSNNALNIKDRFPTVPMSREFSVLIGIVGS